MLKKVNVKRAFACLLVLFALMAALMAFGEGAVEETPSATEAPAPEAAAETNSDYDPYDVPGITVSNGDITAIPNPDEGEQDPEIDFLGGLKQIWDSTGLKQGTWQQYAMLAVACLLLYLAIVKGFEPLLLLPIAFGMLLSNLPMGGLMSDPVYKVFTSAEKAAQYGAYYGKSVEVVLNSSGKEVYQVLYQNGGLLHYLYQGVKLGIYPPLIFMGVGAMTDFGPLIANPKSLLLGAAAQLGIFMAFLGRQAHWAFTAAEAASIGIIGGADGPTAIFVTTQLAPHLLGPIAVAAYSYMALVPVIQPPIMKALTTKKERTIRHGAAAPGFQDGTGGVPHHGHHHRLPAAARCGHPDRHADAGQPHARQRRGGAPVQDRAERAVQYRHHLPGPHRGRHHQGRNLPDASRPWPSSSWAWSPSAAVPPAACCWPS